MIINNLNKGFTYIVLICFLVGLVGIVTGCDVLPEEEPEEQVIDDPFEEQEEEPEELEELPSSSEKEDSEDEQEKEAGSESVEQGDGGEAVPAEQYETGDYKVIVDGDYLLALVTKGTTLKSSYSPADLRQIPSHMNPSYEMYLRSEALALLEQLYQAAEEDGVALGIRSAYRSYSTQKRLFNDYASRHGEEEANRFSARPGQSEHQLGTTVDFGGTAVDFTAEFGQTPRGIWLAENAHKYGFALSYPRNKEDITGYIYEPWHFRYIGVEAAREWKESGLTLREYLEEKPQYFD
ncbi:MAG: M15 family metallopeptidase [Bacillota bacterium]